MVNLDKPADENAERIETLIAAVNFLGFLRDNPELRIPGEFLHLSLWVSDKEEMAQWAKALPKPQTKDASDDYFYLRAKVGEFPVTIMTARKAVCTPRVIGQETYMRKIYPDPVVVEDTRDVIEWVCDPILAD